jgi:hypothetical protein
LIVFSLRASARRVARHATDVADIARLFATPFDDHAASAANTHADARLLRRREISRFRYAHALQPMLRRAPMPAATRVARAPDAATHRSILLNDSAFTSQRS